MMSNLMASIEYDGTMFKGSQMQPNARTVQGSFNQALSLIHNKDISSEFASRTDSGVHAFKQVVSFKSNLKMSNKTWTESLNYNLPNDIRVFKCNAIEYNFDVRRDAVEREYLYKIIFGDWISPIEYNYYEHVNEKLNFDDLESVKKTFIGKHDFLSFTGRLLPKNANTIREINRIDFKFSDRVIKITIAAKSFLYQQVRRIIGSIILFMKNKIKLNNIKEALEVPTKGRYNLLASSKGLYLSNIKYNKI